MSASFYQLGNDMPLVNAAGTLVPENFTVTSFPTTLFNLTKFTYVPNTGSLQIYINGVKQRTGIDFFETAANAFTLSESPLLGDVVTAEGFVGITVAIPDAEYLRLQLAASTGATMVGTAAYNILSASTVQQNLKELSDAFAATLSLQVVQEQIGVAFGTTGSSTAYFVDMTGMTVPAGSANTRLQLTFDETNTSTTPTLQLTGWAAAPIKVFNSAGAKVNPAIGSIVAGGIYDATFDGTNWVILTYYSSASSGSGDVSNNDLLNWIYQAKAFAGYRRGINLFADGFKAADGINAGASSGYTLNTTLGNVTQPVVFDAQTVSVLHMNGTNGSTTFTDATGLRTWTTAGNAQIATATSKFGGGSGSFDGNGDYVLAPTSTDFDFAADFTIDFWANISTLGRINTMVCREDGSGNAAIMCRIDASNNTDFFYRDAANNIIGRIQVAAAISTAAWNHFAYVRNGSNFTLYKNGVSIGTATSAAVGTTSYAFPVAVGGRQGTAIEALLGYMDEVRISKGIARWTANFTPPTAEYTGATAAMTLVSTAQTTPASTKVRALLEYDNVDTPALNTDLSVEVTCNGGTNWQPATLVAAGVGQSGRFVAESGDTTCVAGTSIAMRIKNLNSKSIPIYGVAFNNKV